MYVGIKNNNQTLRLIFDNIYIYHYFIMGVVCKNCNKIPYIYFFEISDQPYSFCLEI